MSLSKEILNQAITVLKQGGIIAYPTEAVYGLGCDPFNETAVKKILQIKNRPIEKGLIIAAANWAQIKNLVSPKLTNDQLQKAFDTWPGPYTWIFPASDKTPSYLCQPNHTIALRVSANPTIQEICQTYKSAIVSTSANKAGEPPLLAAEQVKNIFSDQIDLIIIGETESLEKPTPIRDLMTGKSIR